MKTLTILILTIIITFGSQPLLHAQKRKIGKIGFYMVEPLKQEIANSIYINQELVNRFPAITLERERSLLPFLSLGTELSFSKWATKTGESSSSNYSGLHITSLSSAFRAIGHFKVMDVIEFYATYGLRFRTFWVKSPNNGTTELTTQLQRGFHKNKYISAGANLTLSDDLGIFGELGVQDSSPLFKLGIIYSR